MTRGGRSKFVIYRDVQDGYRWRLRSTAGETLEVSSRGHREKSSCYEEIRSVMADRHPAADILDVAVRLRRTERPSARLPPSTDCAAFA